MGKFDYILKKLHGKNCHKQSQKTTDKLGENINNIHRQKLLFLIYKDLLKLEGQRNKNLIEKWENDMNRQFPKKCLSSVWKCSNLMIGKQKLKQKWYIFPHMSD